MQQCRHFLEGFLDEINILIIETDNTVNINGVKYDLKITAQGNLPCVLNHQLYSVWDMRKNYCYWDEVDIACGIAHEMIHCKQIQCGIWKQCSNMVFDDIPDDGIIKKICNENKYMDIPEELINSVVVEGSALFFELYCKSKLSKIEMPQLFNEYRIFAEKNNEYISYYIGARLIYYKNLKGEFSWKKFFNSGSLF